MRLVEPDLSRFVELYLSGKGAGRDQLEKHIYGAGRPHLSFEQLRSIAVPLPPNNEREELMGIVNETLSNLDHLRSACNDEAKRSAGLRQSVLKAAFSGKLVPQDPSDEPADKLLERIRTARAEKPKGKRKKAAAWATSSAKVQSAMRMSGAISSCWSRGYLPIKGCFWRPTIGSIVA